MSGATKHIRHAKGMHAKLLLRASARAWPGCGCADGADHERADTGPGTSRTAPHDGPPAPLPPFPAPRIQRTGTYRPAATHPPRPSRTTRVGGKAKPPEGSTASQGLQVLQREGRTPCASSVPAPPSRRRLLMVYGRNGPVRLFLLYIGVHHRQARQAGRTRVPRALLCQHPGRRAAAPMPGPDRPALRLACGRAWAWRVRPLAEPQHRGSVRGEARPGRAVCGGAGVGVGGEGRGGRGRKGTAVAGRRSVGRGMCHVLLVGWLAYMPARWPGLADAQALRTRFLELLRRGGGGCWAMQLLRWMVWYVSEVPSDVRHPPLLVWGCRVEVGLYMWHHVSGSAARLFAGTPSRQQRAGQRVRCGSCRAGPKRPQARLGRRPRLSAGAEEITRYCAAS